MRKRALSDEDGFDPERDLPGYDVARAKRYSRIKLGLYAAGTAWSVGRATWFVLSGRSAQLRSRSRAAASFPALADPIYIAATSLGSWLISLPLAYIGGHHVERAYGLTKQTTGGWMTEQLKGLAVGSAIQVPLMTGAYAVIRRRPGDWWLILAGVSVPVLVAFSYLAPAVLMPIFNRFQPLREQELADRVTALADRAGVPIAAVMEMDMSRQTEKANAFFAGLGNTKRIVLGDTLIKGFRPEEVEAVVAHELGHQVHGDLWRMVGLASAIGFGGAWVLSKVAPAAIQRTAPRTGVAAVGDVASLPLLELLLSAGGLVAGPIVAAVSRAIERRTDRFALELTGDGATYASAMARLATQNLADPDPANALVLFLYSHPPIAERIRAARAFDRQRSPLAMPE